MASVPAAPATMPPSIDRSKDVIAAERSADRLDMTTPSVAARDAVDVTFGACRLDAVRQLAIL